MTIPKSYEALAADLASEKILSKTLLGQKESYMMLADGRKFDLDALQQRLTVAEQRAADNLKLISGLVEYADNLLADVNNAWIYAGSTGEPETHKDEDYAAALNLLSATVSSHE